MVNLFNRLHDNLMNELEFYFLTRKFNKLGSGEENFTQTRIDMTQHIATPNGYAHNGQGCPTYPSSWFTKHLNAHPVRTQTHN